MSPPLEVQVKCINIRTKDYYVGVPFHPSGIETDIEKPCWCLKTMQPFGPDNEAVSDSKCRDGRGCFEPDAL